MTASTADSEFALPSPAEVLSGFAVLIVAPAIIAFNTAAKDPTLRSWLKQGMALTEQSREAIAVAQEHWEDLTAEVQAELINDRQIATPPTARLTTELQTIAITLDVQTRALTRGWVDLKTLVPLGLGAIALRQLLTKGLQLDAIPWYVLLWYAFDSFVILNRTPATITRDEPPER
ncbi:DUF5132 domain-containing protein [Trichothermofontia sichuanensis B231]|uniref:DUF5132 domain-containing protein n=1 Tax=Trichothermofontia sichuanensis TaxID=3045816 RepID=UPI0022473045|nr:DUF5132 domain-containing protein [Trichothermofontia sichuanensis]UZQ54483.1 DUF5132 domain-containing protein [Trichothermofontia sichuanensis B231]